MAETRKAVRLAKVAREINVGIDTITAHLLKKGFEVESKPTTKLTPEMYDILISDFKSSIALKHKANQISLRNKRERETKKVDNLGVKVVLSDNTNTTPTNKRSRRKDVTPKKEPEASTTKRPTLPENKTIKEKDSPKNDTPSKLVNTPSIENKVEPKEKASTPPIENKVEPKEKTTPPPIENKVEPKEKTTPPPIENKVEPKEKTTPSPIENKIESKEKTTIIPSISISIPVEEQEKKASPEEVKPKVEVIKDKVEQKVDKNQKEVDKKQKSSIPQKEEPSKPPIKENLDASGLQTKEKKSDDVEKTPVQNQKKETPLEESKTKEVVNTTQTADKEKTQPIGGKIVNQEVATDNQKTLEKDTKPDSVKSKEDNKQKETVAKVSETQSTPIDQKSTKDTVNTPENKSKQGGQTTPEDNGDTVKNIVSRPEIKLAGPKVKGKIDLSGTNWKTRPDKKKKRKERRRRSRPTTEERKSTVNQEGGAKDGNQERNLKERPKLQLQGPKVVGKIDLNSKQGGKKEGEGSSTDGDGKRKRRRRKRIIKSPDKKLTPKSGDRTPSTSGPTRSGGGERTLRAKKRRRKKPQTTNRVNEVSEVSAKEIQDKIKATMAKLSGTSKGKSNRAKLRKQKREQAASKREAVEESKENNILSVTEFISVNEFAKLMDVPVNKVITTCFGLGIIVSINQRLDAAVIELVADEFGFKTEFINVTEEDEEETLFNDAPEDLEPRAPVVTIMGHVDHGKTSLLDYIRNANVIAGEMGGITQHIGAYEVTTESGKEITFLDTPGHEAFTAMRARGAKVTDIAVIVIAADDSIMPQTKEAISHAQAASVPMIFAINKVDKPTALPEKIKEQLAAMNLLVEDWGGNYQSQEISAKFGTNIDDLLEKILLEAELLELKANPNREAVGTVLEASLDKGRGYVSNILVQNGSLQVGDMVLAGQHVGKVKAMFNERGKRVKGKVGPATPVTILGLNGAPQAGDRIRVMDNEQEAKSIATKRSQIIREQGFRASKHITLEEITRRLKIGTFKELNLIVKGDVDGSVEALTDSLLKLSTEEIRVNVIHRGVGAITESDVLLATASDAIIVGFQVRPTINARRNAESESIEIRTYSIIYDAIEEIKSAMEGMLEPKVEERFVCNIEIREVFKISKVGTIAGCYVAEGKVKKDTKIHLLRDGIIIYTGEIETLKRYKDDVKEVLPGQECGIRIKNYNDVKAGDVIEGYEEIEVKRRL